MSHIAPVSFKVNSTISAYRIVTALTSTANTVQLAGAATNMPLGVTANDVTDTTTSVPVVIGGIAKLYFNDTIASGRFVASDAAGRGVLHVDTTAGSYVIGTLVGPTVALTGTIAEVLIQPFFKSIP